jgi:hypothetical protein
VKKRRLLCRAIEVFQSARGVSTRTPAHVSCVAHASQCAGSRCVSARCDCTRTPLYVTTRNEGVNTTCNRSTCCVRVEACDELVGRVAIDCVAMQALLLSSSSSSSGGTTVYTASLTQIVGTAPYSNEA